jgi:hypothetical protein
MLIQVSPSCGVISCLSCTKSCFAAQVSCVFVMGTNSLSLQGLWDGLRNDNPSVIEVSIPVGNPPHLESLLVALESNTSQIPTVENTINEKTRPYSSSNSLRYAYRLLEGKRYRKPRFYPSNELRPFDSLLCLRVPANVTSLPRLPLRCRRITLFQPSSVPVMPSPA